MFPLTQAHMLGICVIIYGASKFCEPMIGKLCDNWVSSLGRRLPLANLFLFASLCIMCAITVCMIFVETPAQLYVASLAFGLGNGFMLSASFALAVQHIPHGQQESLR